MTNLIRYCPQTSPAEMQAFEQRLYACPGSWSLSKKRPVCDDDPSIVRLHWITPEYQWGDILGFLTFFDQWEHRCLIRSFLRPPSPGLATVLHLQHKGSPIELLWSYEMLLESVQQRLTLQALREVLTFLEIQELISRRQECWWHRGPYLQQVHDFGHTLEWLVQEHLRRFHGAFAYRCVHLRQWDALGLNDVDVLAFLPDGRRVLVECKSGNLQQKRQIATRFLQRATAFPADIALLLLDTESPMPVNTLCSYLNEGLQRSPTHLGASLMRQGSYICRLSERIFVANTASGIAATMRGVLYPDAALRSA